MFERTVLTFRPPKVGVAFKDNKLYCFDNEFIEVIRLWPNPQAWQKAAEDPEWRSFWAEVDLNRGRVGSFALTRFQYWCRECCYQGGPGQLCFDFRTAERRARGEYVIEKYRQFIDSMIPRAVRRTVKRFPDNHFELLCFVSRTGGEFGPGYELLAETNPGLAFALSLTHLVRKPKVSRPWRSIRALMRRRQRDMANWLFGLPGEGESVRKILLKVRRQSLSLKVVKALGRALMVAEWRKVLQHAETLNASALRIISRDDLRQHVTPSFIMELARRCDEDSHPYSLWILRDTINMHRQLHGETPLIIHSRTQLRERHDELALLLNRRTIRHGRTYPCPPIIGEANTIVPVRTTEALRDLAVECRNCALSRDDSISETYYVYRVCLEGEVATLALRRVMGGQWAIAELAGKRNGKVSTRLRTFVTDWLARENDYLLCGRETAWADASDSSGNSPCREHGALPQLAIPGAADNIPF